MSLLRQSVDIPAFATTQLALLDAELQSELQETSGLISNTSPTSLQRAGLAITNLLVSSQRTGLGGRTVLELSPDSATAGAGGELPEHGIRTGDIVLVSEQPAGSAKKREIKDLEKKGVRGVVTKIKRTPSLSPSTRTRRMPWRCQAASGSSSSPMMSPIAA